MVRCIAYGRCRWIICCNDSTLHHRHFLFAGRNHLGNLQVGYSFYQLTVMQTKFKWTDKQRLLMVGGLSMGISMAPSLEMAKILADDLYIFSQAPADFLNSDTHVQVKLKNVFEFGKMMNLTDVYDNLIKLDKEDDTDSFAA